MEIQKVAFNLQLLEKDPSVRLGIAACSAGDVCDQPFFKPIDFAKLERKDIVPPYRPKLVSLPQLFVSAETKSGSCVFSVTL